MCVCRQPQRAEKDGADSYFIYCRVFIQSMRKKCLMAKQSFSCDCGNVLECIEEDEVTKPRYRSISGNVRLRCNDCGKEHAVFLKYKIAKFVGASPSFKEIE